MPAMADSAPIRVLLDLQFTPDDSNTFVPDVVMEALDSIGTIGEVRALWAGDPDGPIGNIPWPRTPSPDEQAQIDEALQKIAEEEAAPPPEPDPVPEHVDPHEVTVGIPGVDQDVEDPEPAPFVPLPGQDLAPEQPDSPEPVDPQAMTTDEAAVAKATKKKK